jgi:hypothetical protein
VGIRRPFQVFLVLFGVICVGISLAHLAVGPDAIMGGSQVNATSDGEDRFYAGLFGAFGLAAIWCARDVERKQVYVSALAAAFLIGGIGRLISFIVVGRPHPFFLAMLVVELVLPVLMVLMAKRVAALSQAQQPR